MNRTVLRGLLAALIICALGVGSLAIQANYDASITQVLKSEGGEKYTNHPNDPGGPTKYGITLKDVRAHIDPDATAETVRQLTRDEALEIYRDKYWGHRCIRGDALPAGLDYVVFDYGVNAGVLRPGVVLRRILAVNTDRCDISDALVAIIVKKDTGKLIRAVQSERRQFYDNIIANKPKLATFRNGWMNRANSVEKVALRMAGGPPAFGLFGEEIEPEAAFGPGKAYLREDAR